MGRQGSEKALIKVVAEQRWEGGMVPLAEGTESREDLNPKPSPSSLEEKHLHSALLVISYQPLGLELLPLALHCNCLTCIILGDLFTLQMDNLAPREGEDLPKTRGDSSPSPDSHPSALSPVSWLNSSTWSFLKTGVCVFHYGPMVIIIITVAIFC